MTKAPREWHFSQWRVLFFHFFLSLSFSVVIYVEIRNDKDSTPGIRRVSSQGGSLNRGLQSWGTGPPPLPREPPPHEEPTPPPKTPK